MNIKFCIFFSILIFNRLSHFKTHLISALIRHGARAHAEVTPAFRKIGVRSPKQLTMFGKLQLYELAKKIKKQYFSLSKPRVQFLTSPSSRCQESMKSFINGFVDKKKHKLKTTILPKSFFNQRKLSYFPEEKIKIINSKHAEIAFKMLDKAKRYGFDKVFQNYCKNCTYPETPFQILKTMKKISTIIYCHTANFLQTLEIHPKLIYVLDKGFLYHYFNSAFQTKKEAKDYSKDLLKIIGSSIIKIFKKNKRFSRILKMLKKTFKSEHPARPSTILFGHDGNLIAFLYLLRSPTNLAKHRFFKPPFAAHIKFELVQGFSSKLEYENFYQTLFLTGVEIPLQGMSFVRILYMDQPMKIINCDYKTCTLGQFLKFLKGRINN